MPVQYPARRRLLLAAPAFAAVPWARAQPGRSPGRALVVAQIVDTSTAQQDVSRDFLIGSRAAWQEANARGGLAGRPVQHQTVEVDATQPGAVRAALLGLRDNPGCALLSGTAGNLAAVQAGQALRQERLALAHAAPWLQSGDGEPDDQTFITLSVRNAWATCSWRDAKMGKAGAPRRSSPRSRCLW